MLLDEPVVAGTDIELPISIKIATKRGVAVPAADFSAAVLSLYSADRELKLTKSLNDGIVVEDVDGDSLFIITLANTDTAGFEGLYLVEFTVTDSAGKVSVPVQNELTFKPKLGV